MNKCIHTALDVLKDVFSHIPLAGMDGILQQGRHRSTSERWFYMIAFILSLVLSLYFVSSAWTYYQNNPTAISIGRQSELCQWNAFTVCPNFKFKKHDLKQYIKQSWGNIITRYKYYHNFMVMLSNFSIYNLEHLGQYILNPTLPDTKFLDIQLQFTKEQKIHTLLSLKAIEIMKTTHNYLVPNFQVLQGELGLCYCSNCFYRRSAQGEWKMKITEFKNNLTRQCNLVEDMFYLKANDKVYVHLPYDIPEYYRPFCTGGRKWTQNVELLTQRINSGHRLETLSQKQRKCRFLQENTLSVMPWYAQKACLMQCRHDFILKSCGCIPHIYRHEDEEKVCGLSGLICMAYYRNQINQMVIKEDNCSCLPNCDVTHYYPLIQRQKYIAYSECFHQRDEHPRMTLVRDIVYSNVDMMASWGGAVSSLLGISFVNMIEIVYLLLRGCLISVISLGKISQLCFWCGNFSIAFTPRIWKNVSKSMRTWLRRINKKSKVFTVIYQGASQTFEEWITESSLHGIKYINYHGFTTLERSLWFMTFIGMIIASYWVAVFLVESQNPILYEMHVSQSLIPIGFPSVTICPNVYYEAGANPAGELRPTRRAVCFQQSLYPNKRVGYIHFKEDNVHLHCDEFHYPDMMNFKDLYEGSLDFKHYMKFCKIDSKLLNCFEEFQHYKTETGPCLAINSWQTEKGNISMNIQTGTVNENKLQYHVRQKKISYTFIHNALTVLSIPSIKFHQPQVVPGIQFENDYHLTENIAKTITFKIRETIADEDVQMIDIEDRNCRMPQETLLNSYYPVYSYSACEAECRSRLMLKLCGCIHPSSPFKGKVPVCSYEKLKCFQEHLIELLSPLKSKDIDCSCKMDCLTADYFMISYNRDHANSLDDRANVTLKIHGSHEQVRMRVIRGDIETFVTIGGVCGLFFGASMMSFMEVLLFSVFRLIHNIYIQLRKKDNYFVP